MGLQKMLYVSELCGELAENYCAFADLVVSEDGEARFKWLEEKITFMYR